MQRFESLSLALHDYRTKKDIGPLDSWINKHDKIDATEWYHMATLIQEPGRILNMPDIDYYLPESLDIFTKALKKVNNKTGKISLDKPLSMNVVYEKPEIFEEFFLTYKEVAKPPMPLTNGMLRWAAHDAKRFWEHFFNKMEYLCEESLDKNIHFLKNAELVFSHDKVSKRNLAQYVEHSIYPEGNFVYEAINYIANYENYLAPVHTFIKWQTNETYTKRCKVLKAMFDAQELSESLAKTESKKLKSKI